MSASPSSRPRLSLLDRIGFPTEFSWGLLAVLVFVIGDGIEVVWLSSYLSTSLHYTVSQAGLVITAYGIVVAVASFLSSVIVDVFGPRRVMLAGLVLFVVFDLLFILVGIPSHNLGVLGLVYALRGFGYPLFAYGFLTWLMYVAKPGKQSSTAGWFWFSFSVGTQVLGSYLSAFLLPGVGAISTLWIGFAFTVIGGVGGLLLMRQTFIPPHGGERGAVAGALGRGISIVWRRPKIGLSGLVKVINIAGITGFVVFYVPFLSGTVKLPLTQSILFFTVLSVVAVIADLVFGLLGDVFGWRNTSQYFGALLCLVGALYMYYVPLAVGPNFWAIAVGGIIFGAGLGGFVPMTALMSALAPGEIGGALGIVNLGTGVGSFVGPAIASALLVPFGVGGVVWVFAAMYALSFILLFFITLPGNARTLGKVGDEHVPSLDDLAEGVAH